MKGNTLHFSKKHLTRGQLHRLAPGRCLFPYLQTSVVGWVPLTFPTSAASLLLLLSVGVMIVPAGNVALGTSLRDSLGLGDLLVVVDTDMIFH